MSEFLDSLKGMSILNAGGNSGNYDAAGNYANSGAIGAGLDDPFQTNFSNQAGIGNIGLGQEQGGGIFGDLFGGGGGFMDSAGGMLGGVGDIMGAYAAMKNYGLAEDALGFQKDAYSTDLANKAQLINEKRKYQAERQSLYGGGSQADVAAAGAQSDATGVRDKI